MDTPLLYLMCFNLHCLWNFLFHFRQVFFMLATTCILLYMGGNQGINFGFVSFFTLVVGITRMDSGTLCELIVGTSSSIFLPWERMWDPHVLHRVPTRVVKCSTGVGHMIHHFYKGEKGRVNNSYFCLNVKHPTVFSMYFCLI